MAEQEQSKKYARPAPIEARRENAGENEDVAIGRVLPGDSACGRVQEQAWGDWGGDWEKANGGKAKAKGTGCGAVEGGGAIVAG